MPTDDSTLVTVFTGGTERLVPQNLTATLIAAADDENSNLPSFVSDNSEVIPMSIVREATLLLSMNSVSELASPGQPIDLSATLQNVGTADIEPGDSVWVRLDTTGTGFTFRSGDVARKRLQLVSGSAGVTWLLTAAGSVGDYDLIALVDDSTAYDENKYIDSLVFRQQGEDTTVVTVVTGGAVAVTNIRLITPPGAVDDTISTSQSFTLEAAYSFIGSVDTTGRTARLVLPAGYTFIRV